MRVETRVVTETYWIADDGTEFDNEYNCFYYEKSKKLVNVLDGWYDNETIAEAIIKNWQEIKNLMES